MKNNTFGFISFANEFPYMQAKKRKKELKSGILRSSRISCLSKWFGSYTLSEKTLTLHFNETDKMIDSVAVRLLPTEKGQKSVTVYFIPHYNYKATGMHELQIVDDHNRIFSSIYENKLTPNAGIGRFPLQLKINDEKKLLLSDAQNQEVQVYINTFQKF